MLTRDWCHFFWRDPNAVNMPHEYAAITPHRAAFLVKLLKKYCPPPATAFEPGCNVGRNLAAVKAAGYTVSGVEINQDAVALARDVNPTVAIRRASLEHVLKRKSDVASVDAVYTMAVLEHIHPDSEWLFDRLAQMATKCLITIEDELHNTERHKARNYRIVFEALGLKQVEQSVPPENTELGTAFIARVFMKDQP